MDTGKLELVSCLWLHRNFSFNWHLMKISWKWKNINWKTRINKPSYSKVTKGLLVRASWNLNNLFASCQFNETFELFHFENQFQYKNVQPFCTILKLAVSFVQFRVVNSEKLFSMMDFFCDNQIELNLSENSYSNSENCAFLCRNLPTVLNDNNVPFTNEYLIYNEPYYVKFRWKCLELTVIALTPFMYKPKQNLVKIPKHLSSSPPDCDSNEIKVN